MTPQHGVGIPFADRSRGPRIDRDETLVGGALSGWIIEAGSALPVPGAELTFASSNGVHVTRTGDDGRFDFRPALPGAFALIGVTATGFAPRLRPLNDNRLNFELSPGRRVEGLRLLLAKRALCTGRTEFSDGGTARGVTLQTLASFGSETPVSVAANSTVSDDGGAFQLPCAPYERIEASLEGFESIADPMLPFPNTRQLVLVLAPKGPQEHLPTIQGVVVNGRGEPIPDALVGARGPLSAGPESRLQDFGANTDSNGRFVLEVPIAGAYRFDVYKHRLRDGQKTDFDTGATDVELQTGPEGAVEVHAVDSVTGAPLPHVEVGLSKPGSVARLKFDGREFVGATGVARLEQIPEGDYIIWGNANGYSDAPRVPVKIREVSEARIELRFTPGYTVQGRVLEVASARPVALAVVTATRSDGSVVGSFELDRTAITGADGRFSLDGVTPKTHFTASAPGFRTWEQKTVAQGGELLFELSREDADAGEGVEYGGVGLQWDDGPPMTVFSTFPSGPAERSGIRKGDRLLRVDGEPVTSMEDAIQTVRGPVGTGVRLELQRPDAGTLEFRLVRERILSP